MHFGGDGRRNVCLGSSPKEDDIGICFRLQPIRHLGKSRRRPALCRSVRCAGPDGNSRRALACAQFTKKFIGAPPLRFWNVQSNECFVLKGIQPTGAAKKFQIIKLLMRRNLSLPGKRHGLGQKKAAGVASIADAFGNIGSPGQPRGVERILQQQGHVKLLCAEFCGQPLASEKTRMQAFWVVWDELIADFLIAINIGDIGTRDDGNFRIRKTLAHRAKRR